MTASFTGLAEGAGVAERFSARELPPAPWASYPEELLPKAAQIPTERGSMGAVQPRKAWAQNGPNVTRAAFYYCSREATQPVYTHWSREMDSTS